jgi:S1-C subfamily serine protease
LVESDGYVVTNYHVIERAYQIQSMQRQIQDQIEAFVQNVTCDQNGRLMANLLLRTTSMQPPPPKVYCRINSASEYEACRIVQVQPDLDVAVLKIENSTTSSWPTAAFGASSDLLVGQSLVAIGNPFGLDQTVTSGVVSALNREISTSTSQTIRNCIQTDAAINPGNSGGPLLNLAGEVVGVNTAIVTTSGSNAGIGFAIPSDKVKPVVRDMIRTDRAKRGVRPKAGYLGIGIVKATLNKPGNWILTVEPDSPAAEAGLKALQVLPTGQILYGDAVVAVAGNFVANYDDLTKEIENRVEGEELSLTLEDGVTGERRVAYIKLGSRPQA